MPGPIRITQVLEATAGGTRRYLQEAVTALSSDEFELHIVCALNRDPSFQEDVEAYRRQGHRVSIVAMAPGVAPLHDAKAIWQLRRLLKQNPCDILHLHSSKAGGLGRLAARGLGCRVIYSPHCFSFLRRDSPWAPRVYELAERSLAGQADLLLAVSEAEGRLAVESGLFTADRVRMLSNALDIREFDEQMAKLPPLSSSVGTRTFGLIGDLRLQKAPMVFLEAARRLRDRNSQVAFVLPLHGPDLAKASQFVHRHEMESCVEFLPAETSLLALLQRTDVAVLPSLWEGLPYMMLDALASRRPLIASDLPVFRDLLSPIDSRLLFPAGDAGALAERMAVWAQLPATELESVGERGRRCVLENHDHAAWQQQLRAVYRSIIEV
jgi:glycosyltransferase involved in cell wall biosynthesis